MTLQTVAFQAPLSTGFFREEYWSGLPFPSPEHIHTTIYKMGYPDGTSGKKNPPANTGDIRDAGSIPGLRRSPGGGYGNPLQYSCLENPHGLQGLAATVHRITESQTLLKQFSTLAYIK